MYFWFRFKILLSFLSLALFSFFLSFQLSSLTNSMFKWQEVYDVLLEYMIHSCMDCICTQGIEDYLGDMDFKMAGTSKGINALQVKWIKAVKVAMLGFSVCVPTTGHVLFLTQLLFPG